MGRARRAAHARAAGDPARHAGAGALDDGLRHRRFKEQAGGRALLGATLVAGATAALLLGPAGLVALALAAAATWLFARYCLGRLPGLTGDTYGALDELVETLLLVTLPALLRWLA